MHPSHRGSTYQRKPKKKKKKKRPTSAKAQENYDAYYLAPIDPNSPNYRQQFVDDDELNMNAGGKGQAGTFEIAEYDGAPGSQEGMEDMDQAAADEEEARRKAAELEAAKPRRKRKRADSNLTTFESGFSVIKKDKQSVDLMDYDKLAHFDQLVYAGKANIHGEEIDPNALLEPHEQDIDPEGDTCAGILSYKKVKMYQYKMHPRDRRIKQKFPWW